MRGGFCIIFLATLLLGSCGVPKNRFRLSGKFKNIRSADIFIYSDDRYDTLHIRDGKFKYERDLTEPLVLTIQYPDFTQRNVIAEPGREAKFVTNARDLSQTRVTGTEENELLSRFYAEAEAGSEEQKEALAREFVNHNPAALAAQAVYQEYILPHAHGGEAQRLLALMLKRQPHNGQLSRLAGRVLPMLATLPGAKAPAFKVKTSEGAEITNDTFKGKYLLISFWASWQYESFQGIRSLKGIIRPFRGRIGVINVCMDYNYRSYANTLRRDTLPGYNMCDRRVWNSPLVKLFGVNFVPGNVLISPEGKIIARDLNERELGARLGKLIKL